MVSIEPLVFLVLLMLGFLMMTFCTGRSRAFPIINATHSRSCVPPSFCMVLPIMALGKCPFVANSDVVPCWAAFQSRFVVSPDSAMFASVSFWSRNSWSFDQVMSMSERLIQNWSVMDSAQLSRRIFSNSRPIFLEM